MPQSRVIPSRYGKTSTLSRKRAKAMVADLPQKQNAQSSDQGIKPSPIRDFFDAMGNLGPIAVIIAAIVGGCIANAFQRQISGSTLLSERERSESALRASMFNSLIEPIGGAKKGEDIPVDREQLLVELLALNFHEHFELKPLFDWVERRRALEGPKGVQARKSLRSIARRIVDRQIAALRKEGSNTGTGRHGAKVYSLTVTEKPQNEQQGNAFKLLKGAERRPDELVGAVAELISDVESPDGRHNLGIIVLNADWENQALEVKIDAFKSGAELEESFKPFTITWYDFPLTDNTLFPDGNRFALTVYRVDDVGGLKRAELKLIWFPRNYFTPRERPLEHRYFLELVGKTTD